MKKIVLPYHSNKYYFSILRRIRIDQNENFYFGNFSFDYFLLCSGASGKKFLLS